MRLGRTTIVSFAFFVALGCTGTGPREVLLVARGMTFNLASTPNHANPVIHLRAGERVRITLRNDALGLMHDFEIPSWDVKSEQIRGGQTTSVLFTVPEREGRVEYICRPHSSLMHGYIEVSAK
ncbi:MAG TPA: plastocyanin/azurin family copper-binding protein [Vicinamibacterales bacterium]|nr:plastocyanin/azurin family copper-binding protein [Vicinamibacterales bacterium]